MAQHEITVPKYVPDTLVAVKCENCGDPVVVHTEADRMRKEFEQLDNEYREEMEPNQKVTHIDIVRTFGEDNIQTAQDVADKLPISYSTARRRLLQLVEDRVLETKTVSDGDKRLYYIRGAFWMEPDSMRTVSTLRGILEYKRGNGEGGV